MGVVLLSKRFRVIAACACACAVAAVAVLAIGRTAPSDVPPAGPALVIGYDEYRPFTYVDDNGDMAGIDADIAQEACRRAGLQAQFKRITWENRDDYLSTGSVDCLWSCYSINDREDDYAWVGPYMSSRQVVAVLDDSPIRSFDDLAGKRVAVKAATKPEGIFLNQEGVPGVEDVFCLSDMNEVASALRNKYVDAVAGHSATLHWYLQSIGAGYRILDGELMRSNLGVAFPKGSDPAVRDALSAALRDMLADGTISRILATYGLDPDLALVGVADEL